MELNQLKTEIVLDDDKVKFIAYAGENNPLVVDYVPPVGSGEGYTSLELLMISLSSCLTTAVLILLRKNKKQVLNAFVTTTGRRRPVHPTYLEEINIELNIISPDVDENDLLQVIKISEETICPVLNMLKDDVKVNIIPVIHHPADIEEYNEKIS